MIDGIGADADVTFVLTTNRATDLEEALVDRPGRVDLAVEVPRPDAAGRRHLLELYGGRALTADAFGPALDAVVNRTDGVTASFVKEFVRRAVLKALRRGGDGDGSQGTPVAEVRDLEAALASMSGQRYCAHPEPPRCAGPRRRNERAGRSAG